MKKKSPAFAGAPAAALRPAGVPVSLWILGSWRDLLLFVGTPLLIVPVLRTAELRWTVEDIALFVASFGAMGHHLPGLLRAYGDPALFRRYRTRFIAAPLVLLGVCGLFGYYGLSGILVIAFFWGVWHALMQTYGFVRIYDARTESYAPRTCRLDLAMCITWFGLVILWSPTRLPDILGLLYKSGVGFVPGAAVRALQLGWAGVTALVTLLFLLNLALLRRRRQRVSPVKILLMAATFAFFWYANVYVKNILLGIALFEIFHDVQYLSIVWIFNRARVRKDRSLPAFTRFLFRESPALTGVYVGLVFAYGALNLVPRGVPDETVRNMLMGLLAASGLLHFYYDGFIWKVRETGVRQSLGLKPGGSKAAGPNLDSDWRVHGLKWLLFAVPVAWFGVAESKGTPPELDRRQAIASALPDNGIAAYDLGSALRAQGRLEEAAREYRRALQLEPSLAEAQSNYGAALGAQGRYPEAIGFYERALALRPTYAEAHNNLGIALAALGRNEEAIESYGKALRLKPGYAEAHNNLGIACAAAGREGEALRHFTEALGLRPDYPEAHGNAGTALLRFGQADRAIEHFTAALGGRPADPELHFKLGLALEARGSTEQAASEYSRTLELEPRHEAAMESLERVRRSAPRGLRISSAWRSAPSDTRGGR